MFFSNKLIDAAEDGDIKTVKSELEKGRDINSRGMMKMTALMGACVEGQVEMVKFLLKQPGIKVDVINAGGTTALMAAARKGNLEIVKILLNDERCDPNKLGKYGNTAIINAAGSGHIEVVKEFLKVKDISLEASYSEEKYSPITIAEKNGFTEIAKLIKGFDVNRKSQNKAKPINKPPMM